VTERNVESLALPGGRATICWRRHGRARRITLRIDPGPGHVVVTLPLRAGRAAGMALLARNAEWVTAGLAALPHVPRFAEGGSVCIDGLPHAIRHAGGGRGVAWLDGPVLRVPGETTCLPRRVAAFLRAEARTRLTAQAVAKAAQAGLELRRVAIKDTRTRWGSCSSAGVLMFCWRVLMAPPFVQDYVVAHEVAHLRHLDHGAAFWALTDQLSPHRQAAIGWLATEGPRLLRVA
jgi:predicted metal-dependent hydrolase